MAFADSFGAAHFAILGSGFNRVVSTTFSLRHIPGGNISYLDTAGRRSDQWQTNLLFENLTEFTLMENLVGSIDSLTWFGGTIVVYLASIAETNRLYSGEVEATAEFIRIMP